MFQGLSGTFQGISNQLRWFQGRFNRTLKVSRAFQVISGAFQGFVLLEGFREPFEVFLSGFIRVSKHSRGFQRVLEAVMGMQEDFKGITEVSGTI